MAGNTTTKKQYGSIGEQPSQKALAPKTVNFANRGAVYEGQMKGPAGNEKFADPHQEIVAGVGGGINGLYDDIGEKSGFITDGYLDKGDTPYGEEAKFNYMPPGMDIDNQVMAEIHEMPMRTVVDVSYPDDGWAPKPRNVTK
jgi:hypothetical protein